MIYLDLIFNLALLVALSIISGFIDKRCPRDTWTGVLLQGFLWGSVSIVGMLQPLVMGPGLIFDGRSIIISLCALFFGHRAAALTGAMAAAYRLALGGPGAVMGVSVILASAVIGLLARHYLRPQINPPSTPHLFFLGLAVHAAMVALMFTLPGELAMSTLKRLGLPVITLYPLATILAGKILSDQASAIQQVEALRRSEEKYKIVFETANVAKSVTLPTGEINVNQTFCDMLGYTREELRNKKWQDITPADEVNAIQKLLDSLLQGKKDSTRFDKRYIHKNGSYIWADVSVAIQRDIDRNPLFFITTIIDITARRQAEKALRESEARLNFALETNHIGVWELNLLDHTAYRTLIHDRIFGYETLLPSWTYEMFLEHVLPEDRPEVNRHFSETTVSQSDWNFECRIRRTDGEVRWILAIGRHLLISIGEPVHMLGIVQDITERKQAESQKEALLNQIQQLNIGLEQKVAERTKELHDSQLALLNLVDDLNLSVKSVDAANQTLAATNKELEAFSYSVSHDLRAPLRSIDGFSDALLEDYQKILDAPGKNYLERIRKATQHMGGLIDDMLKLSRVTKAGFHYQPVDLSEMVRSITAALKKNNPKIKKKVIIQKGIAVRGDPYLLHIALENLIDNAWKFTGRQKEPQIEFGATLKEEKNVFFIRDNGVGFDMAYAHKLFGVFQRLHTSDEFPGTGIGLATVQRIVHRHGGKIWAESEVGKGAVFYFTLK